jgi:hypothetical protein
MNEQDLRDCFAMFALAGLLMRGNNKLDLIPESCYILADQMLEARKPKEVGIRTVKRTRKNNDET